ncbi:hypothetical protein Pelo_10958 [Pelomyxa schiedti]|nr:hypothetical protein Pelo_10958 [Pelomyxa schiedti]
MGGTFASKTKDDAPPPSAPPQVEAACLPLSAATTHNRSNAPRTTSATGTSAMRGRGRGNGSRGSASSSSTATSSSRSSSTSTNSRGSGSGSDSGSRGRGSNSNSGRGAKQHPSQHQHQHQQQSQTDARGRHHPQQPREHEGEAAHTRTAKATASASASNSGGAGGGGSCNCDVTVMSNATATSAAATSTSGSRTGATTTAAARVHHDGVLCTRGGGETVSRSEPTFICDVCNLEILGTRFHCLQCADYDLCDRCERIREDVLSGTSLSTTPPRDCEVKPSGPIKPEIEPTHIHDPKHCFLKAKAPMRNPARLKEFKAVSDHQIVHRGILCSNCRFPVIGVRYTCMNCKEFNLCEECECKPVHNAQHVFAKLPFAVVVPHDRFSILSASEPFQKTEEATKQPRPLPPANASIEIVQFAWDHAPDVLRIEKESFHKPYEESYFYESLQGNNVDIHVAILDSQVCGYIALQYKKKATHIASVAVSKASRGSGVGGALVAFSIHVARQRHLPKVMLQCSVFNRPAISLYYRFGFQPTQWLPDYYHDENEDGLLMSCDVECREASEGVDYWQVVLKKLHI